jgi:D-aspartate ligase
VDFDRQVPALIFQIGADPVYSGPLGAIRTLGRVGVPMYAIIEPGLSPAGASRYCTGRFVWRATARDDPARLAADLRDVGRQISRRSVIIPVDDESAVLVAEYAAELSDYFLFPQIRSGLPRQLASKSGLHTLCQDYAVPTPATVVPASAAEAAAFAAVATFPVVVKNAMVWDRGRHNTVGVSPGASSSGTRVLYRPEDLLNLLRPDRQEPGLIIQEHIPAEQSEDWFVHLYCDANSDCTLLFTGLKVRSWPPTAGSTACGYSVSNPFLASMSERFCKEIGYTGIADLDWRLDLRDGQYKLVDFNPRMGNQFRLFETETGVDVVRALHLDLTGRDVPRGPQVRERRIVVEHVDIPARIAYRRLGQRATSAQPASLMKRPKTTSTEFAWLAADDPLPVLAMLTRVKSLAKIVRRARLFPPLPRATQPRRPSAPAT